MAGSKVAMRTYRRAAVTGGAGFVGSAVALMLRERFRIDEVIAFDNLRRRGSQLNLPRLAQGGVGFHHGDVRQVADLKELGALDLVIDCAAEPSVLAGARSPAYVTQTNLNGTLNCLEVCAETGADFVLLSTSRVYPLAPLRALPLVETGTRLELPRDFESAGISWEGIGEDYPLAGARTVYGATKLASELMALEYREGFGVRSIVNRCGVIAGPWQMGKVEQGFMVLWVARHLFGRTLSYMGHGGTGKQVRDVLHVADLCDLLEIQIRELDKHDGTTYNVGGGRGNSTSLLELTAIVQEATGTKIRIDPVAETGRMDIPFYITDNRLVSSRTGWMPRRSIPSIVDEIRDWISANRAALERVLE